MGMLAGVHYDPTTAVSKATTAALAMTAMDTTNLRLSFSVPTSGMVLVRLAGTLHGSSSLPQILMGVLESSSIKGRASPQLSGGNLASTTQTKAEAIFPVIGLTPGAQLTWDAAYGVETAVASTGLKYGGPNNATADDAFGGFTYEIWDPKRIVGTVVGGGGGVSGDTFANLTVTSLATLGRVVIPPQTFPNGATTPSVSNGNIFAHANSIATTVTNLVGGTAGQIVIIILDANTTYQHGTNFKLTGGADQSGGTNHVLMLLKTLTGPWLQMAPKQVNGV